MQSRITLFAEIEFRQRDSDCTCRNTPDRISPQHIMYQTTAAHICAASIFQRHLFSLDDIQFQAFQAFCSRPFTSPRTQIVLYPMPISQSIWNTWVGYCTSWPPSDLSWLLRNCNLFVFMFLAHPPDLLTCVKHISTIHSKTSPQRLNNKTLFSAKVLTL